PAHAAAPAPAKVVAAAPFPGHGATDTAVTPDGRMLVVKTNAGLTTYAIGPSAMKRLGTTRLPGANSYKMLLLRGGRYAYLVREHTEEILKIYDLRGRAPRLVRTVKLVAQPQYRDVRDAVLTPDGRQLVIVTEMFIQTYLLGDPTRPRVAKRTSLISDTRTIAVSPDSTQLLLDDRVGGAALYRLTLRRDGSISGADDGYTEYLVPGWEDRRYLSRITELNYSPGGASVFAEIQSPVEPGSTRVTSAVARIRISDMTMVRSLVAPDDAQQYFLQTRSNNGARVYLTSGDTSDQQELLPRRALWVDGTNLAVRHYVSGLGDVRSLAVSPAGRTRGRLFAAVVRNDRHLVLEIDPR
ncbi:hypothetical protein ACFP8W_22515, partial [Nocardioides hankookensis]